jgi:5-methylthioadenosine/S-adenosylhomocysteine deaminase
MRCNALDLIRGNRIAAVQPTGQIGPKQAIESISGIGMATMPGLLNTHADCAMVLFCSSAEDVPIEIWFNDYIWFGCGRVIWADTTFHAFS